MKRFYVLVMAVLLVLAVAGFVAAANISTKGKTAKTVVKATRVSDEKEIKSAVLKAAHFTGQYKYDGGVAKTEERFDPIVFVGNWASAHYDQTSKVRGLEEIPSQVSYLLKKSKGKWCAIYEYQGGMMLKEIKKVGLTPVTARQLGISVSHISDGDEGRFLR